MIWKNKRLSMTIIIILLSLSSLIEVYGRYDEFRTKSLRSKREKNLVTSPPLIYPFGATLKLLFGCTVPISMPGRILIYAQNFQFQFPLPQNATFFSDYFNTTSMIQRRRRRSTTLIFSERNLFYKILEEEMNRRGGPGKDCLKRSICEYAETPFKDEGLMGEIFHVLLTPDYAGGSDVDEEYILAAKAGRSGQDCWEAFGSCPDGFGFLDHITKVFSHEED